MFISNWIPFMEKTFQPGDYLDNFQIKAVLHSGAMAQIYKALDMLSGETVALKVPFGDILNNRILYYHFQNEERISPFLNHANIVRFMVGDRSRQYGIMEYIPGQDLRTLFAAKTKLPLEPALGLAIQIAEGLRYLHSQDIIHLDIKPENIMITPDNAVKILDFGLACKKSLGDLLTEDFISPHGTPYYISPEQIEGQRNDNRSDLYSLSMILYEALTGKLPFARANRLSRVRDRLKMDPVPPRHYDDRIPPSIQEIILKALARDPEDRYSSAEAMKADLLAYEKVPVTEKGMNTDKPSRWRSRFKRTFSSSKALSGHPDGDPSAKKRFPHILGTIVDHETSDLVIEKVKRQALVSGADVTLLTVVDEQTDSDFTKYQTAVDGERFRKRIDRYVKLLRRYDIDPVVRILEGDVAEVVAQLAQKLQADFIVLGPPRKKGLKKMFGGSTIDRLIRKAPCHVVVAETEATEAGYS